MSVLTITITINNYYYKNRSYLSIIKHINNNN